MTDWTPVLADFAVARRLAGLVEGKSPDNRLQMRLSAFVLANRLDSIVRIDPNQAASILGYEFQAIGTNTAARPEAWATNVSSLR